MRERVLVSACLLGIACRYDGKAKPCEAAIALKECAEIVPFCPEIYGGLPTPRDPAERRGNAVVTDMGADVTRQYEKGAREALRLARMLGIRYALLKERSPSCGSGLIHDGSFTGGMTEGDGVTAALLKENGVIVFDETQADQLVYLLKEGGSDDQIQQ